MPFINVSTYLISDACVLLAVERESEQRDKGARRGSEYPKPQSWGCQCVQRCWSTDLSISVHLGCKGFFVFWRVFFVQHVRSCTSVFLYFFWISADVQKASSSARWKLLLSRIVLKRFCFRLIVLFLLDHPGLDAQQSGYEKPEKRWNDAHPWPKRFALWARPSALYTLRKAEKRGAFSR